jgi:hypothetical protein
LQVVNNIIDLFGNFQMNASDVDALDLEVRWQESFPL